MYRIRHSRASSTAKAVGREMQRALVDDKLIGFNLRRVDIAHMGWFL
jgi:hypothetical protein